MLEDSTSALLVVGHQPQCIRFHEKDSHTVIHSFEEKWNTLVIERLFDRTYLLLRQNKWEKEANEGQ
jgi:hypothetical protein